MLLATFLDLRGDLAVVVGGGAVARRRVGTLLQAGLRVSVIAPTISPELQGQDVVCMERPYQSGDLAGAKVVLACTDDGRVNDRVVADAHALGLLVSHAGDAERGNLRFPASVERGELRVALTTGRELPMLAQALRERLEETLPADLPLGAWVARREQAVSLSGPERELALNTLRHDIRLAVGLSA